MKITSLIRQIREALAALRELYGSHAWVFGLMGLFGLFNGFAGALGIGMLIPLFSFVTTRSLPDTDPVSRAVGRMFAYFDLGASVGWIVAVVVALFLLKAAALFCFKYVGVRIVSGFEADLRNRLYRATLSSAWPFLLHQKIGHLENLLMTQVSGVVRLLSGILSILNNITNGLMYLAVAFAISPGLTAAALASAAAVLAVFKPILRRFRRSVRDQAELQKRVAHEINENVSGLKVIKALAVERPIARTGVDFFRAFRALRVHQGTFKAFMAVLPQPVAVAFISAVFLASVRQPGFNLASFLAVMYLIQQIFLFAEKFQGSLVEVNSALPYASNILAFGRSVAGVEEPRTGLRPFAFERALSFRNVTFGYDSRPVLDRVSFEIRPGEMVGLIGSSGAGKTTIADLLLRLFEPREGGIALDDVPAAEIDLDAWRRNVGYVPQDIFLKNDAVEENIRFFDKGISRKDIEDAARLAHIDHVIRDLPQGYRTVVGERGVLLSAGQRQRIALARVLARAPAILILDEATSALDNESERIIQQALESLRGSMTLVVIAHRISTILSADRVIALENEKVVEQGPPRDLLSNPESYLSRVSRTPAPAVARR